MQVELNAIEARIYQLAMPHLAVRENDIHVANALEFAFKLLETESGDRDIVIPAVILHDVGWSRVSQDIIRDTVVRYVHTGDKSLTRIHEEEGVKIAASILQEVGYGSEQTAKILQIIGGHDSRKTALSINDKIVKDADALTRYAKSFPMYAGLLGVTHRRHCEILESYGGSWFFLPASKIMAREELEQRKRESAAE